jgi:hypothetical protein
MKPLYGIQGDRQYSSASYRLQDTDPVNPLIAPVSFPLMGGATYHRKC